MSVIRYFEPVRALLSKTKCAESGSNLLLFITSSDSKVLLLRDDLNLLRDAHNEHCCGVL